MKIHDIKIAIKDGKRMMQELACALHNNTPANPALLMILSSDTSNKETRVYWLRVGMSDYLHQTTTEDTV